MTTDLPVVFHEVFDRFFFKVALIEVNFVEASDILHHPVGLAPRPIKGALEDFDQKIVHFLGILRPLLLSLLTGVISPLGYREREA